MAEETPKKQTTAPIKRKRSYFTKGESITFQIFTIIVSILVSVILVLLLLPALLRVSPLDLYTGKAFKRQTSKTIIKTEEDLTSVEAVAQKLMPSVVNIRVKKTTSGFFEPQEQEGVGSGVVYRKDGYILTNNHVVEGARDILVTIGDDEMRGTVVGADSEADIAVVKVNRNNLSAAEFERKKPKVGELAVAIGSPLGQFENTVTSGIVSAINRAFDVPEEDFSQKTFTDLIQTDAAINPGNSGGALANAEGKVIGINTLIASQSGGSEGLGFAIPSITALTAAKQLLSKGKVSHPFIGILGRDIDKDTARQNNLPVDEGALIEDVSPGSPADKAGLKAKDIITSFNGNKVSSMEDLITYIRRKEVSDTVTIGIYRGTSKKTVKVKLAEKPRSR